MRALPFLFLSLILLCSAGFSVSYDAESGAGLLPGVVANATETAANATSNCNKSKEDSFAQMFDRALQKEFPESEQNEGICPPDLSSVAADSGGFNSSVAEQQIIRSVCQWSVGAGQTEQSIQNAYCSLIERAAHFIYIENQIFISGLSSNEAIQNRVLDALYRRIIRAYNDNAFFRVIVVLPVLPGFQGGVDDSGAAYALYSGVCA